MINPTKLFQIKNAWDIFSANHPKFSKFLQAAGKHGIGSGSEHHECVRRDDHIQSETDRIGYAVV